MKPFAFFPARSFATNLIDTFDPWRPISGQAPALRKAKM
jgi:hypothetical protein